MKIRLNILKGLLTEGGPEDGVGWLNMFFINNVLIVKISQTPSLNSSHLGNMVPKKKRFSQ